MIIGYSGSGKSTLAKFLSDKYNLPLLYLDKFGWKPNWEYVDENVQISLLDDFLSTHESWVIDGNYSFNNYERRFMEADRIYFLNFNTNTDFMAQRKSFIDGLPALFEMIKGNYDVIGRHSAMLTLCAEFKNFCHKLDEVFDNRDKKLKQIRADVLSSREEIINEINAQCTRRYEIIMLVNDFRNYILAYFAEDQEIQLLASYF